MNRSVNTQRLNAIVWFAVAGGALAWAAQLAVGYQLAVARCGSDAGRFLVPFHAWSLGMASAAVLVGLVGEGAAILVFRATREARRLELKRIHFLAVVAMTINPLVLTIAAMSGVGTSLLSLCHQS